MRLKQQQVKKQKENETVSQINLVKNKKSIKTTKSFLEAHEKQGALSGSIRLQKVYKEKH